MAEQKDVQVPRTVIIVPFESRCPKRSSLGTIGRERERKAGVSEWDAGEIRLGTLQGLFEKDEGP
jgi:hypothetical protein